MSDASGSNRRQLMQSGVVSMLADLVASDALSQDAVITEAGSYRVVLENDSVRVLEIFSRPRTWLCGDGEHSHPAHLTVALSDARVRITLPDGEKIDASHRLGDVFWSEAETHTVENVGSGSVRALIIEIKDPPAR
jgi:hypothetical protein